MNTGQWSRIGVAAALATMVAVVGIAQVLTKTADIRRNPKGYANEVVTIEGFATQWVEAKATTTSFYFLKDDWGGVIKVRTSGEQPLIGERYRVSGPVGIDPTNHNDVYISEEMRIHVRDEPADAGAGVAPPAPVDLAPTPEAVLDEAAGVTGGSGLSPQTLMLIGGIVFVVVLLVILLVWLLRSQRAAPVEDDGLVGDGAGEHLPPPQVVEGGTIKMHAPPPGTLKILPGRFEVVAGDDVVKEIRFYRVKGQSMPELTFGRAVGAPYTHIQLKPMTVSSRQAKITYVNQQWVLTNFAPDTSNPTRHNGVELPVDGQTALRQGDKVEMGEVVLVFHES